MRHFPIFLLAFALLPATVRSQGLPSTPQPAIASDDAGDDESWDRLTFLAPDAKLAVHSTRGTQRCEGPRVTEDLFYCETPPVTLHRFVLHDSAPLQFRRADVLEVRQRHPDRIRWIGYGAALTAGFATGAAIANTRGGEPRFVGGLAGSAIFGLAAMPIVEAVAVFSPGKMLYRRPAAPRNLHSAPGNPQ